jgi:hypothetical protein
VPAGRCKDAFADMRGFERPSDTRRCRQRSGKVLVFVLFSADHPAGRPDTELANFLVPMAVGALPFLIVGALIARTLLGARAANRAGQPRQPSVTSLALISGIGLPFVLVVGFWLGLFASAQELPVGSAADAALTVYQFTWLAAILSLAVTLVMALVTRRSP